MHGCTRRPRAPWLPLLLLPLGLGCSDAPPLPRVEPADSAATDFNSSVAGVIQGRVRWKGDLPSVPPFDYRRNLPSGNPSEPRLVRENPNAPIIDPQSRGIAGAVLFLRGVEARHARPWDHASVRVEHRDRRLHVLQGDTDARTGFVRRGQVVELVSRETAVNVLRGTGAAFFSLTLPDPDRPRRRSFNASGLVELSSGAGYYWMRAYLLVDDHPYYTRTDAAGRFQLPQVPPGRYQLVCWMPNWNIERHERDPETTVISRVFFRPPVQQEQQVDVRPGMLTTTDFNIASDAFQP
jgi:hypothetical protein